MLQRSTIQLLRFRFSFLLLPVYLFALAMSDGIDLRNALIIFVLLHFLLYPASNGYNSYMDRDEGSIGDIEKPEAPTRQLYFITWMMDIGGSLLAFLISPLFAGLYIVYILFSRLYSYRGIRLKQYPVTGYLTVVLNQGGLIFYMVFYGVSLQNHIIPWMGMLVSTLLIGAFYPITQIYQHEQDIKDGVRTLSKTLGVNGTFIYCAVLYSVAFVLLAWHFYEHGKMLYFFILMMWFVPVVVKFLRWALQCWQDEKVANFKNTMSMNWLAAFCTNFAFITLIILQHFG